MIDSIMDFGEKKKNGRITPLKICENCGTVYDIGGRYEALSRYGLEKKGLCPVCKGLCPPKILSKINKSKFKRKRNNK